MIPYVMTPSGAQMKEVTDDIRKACEVLEKGGIIVYPTDTIWGIGCDATNPEAVGKVYELKKREDSKALITLVGNEAWLDRYVEDVPDIAWELIDVSVSPLTIVYDKGKNLAPNLLASDGSIAIRVTNEFYSSELCRRFKRPIVSTSANISGEKSPGIFKEISSEILDKVDFIANWRRDEDEASKPSSIIKVGRGGVIKVIR